MLFLIGCIGDRDQQSDIVDIESCSPPPGAEQLWALPHVRFLVVGELHGTSETPAAFGELVCDAAMARKRVLVGFEFPESARPAFQTYVASLGTVDDRADFLRDSGWLTNAQIGSDGRTSEAMWTLVERLRTLRAAGLDISVTTFVRSLTSGGQTQTPYEMGMATSLREAATVEDYDLTIVLVGSAHALKTRFDLEGMSAFDPMAMHLPEELTLSLLAVTGAGEAWNCQAECGIHQHSGSRLGATPGISLGDDLAPGYDGIVAVGPITVSFPVVVEKP